MSSYVEARDAIVSLVTTALAVDRPTLPVFWENTLSVDLDQLAGDLFLRVEIEMDDAGQLTVNDAPIHRTYGTVHFVVFVREGVGMRSTLDLFGYLTDVVKYQQLPKCTFTTPRPGRRDARQGWVSSELRAPFFFDSIP